MEEKHNVSQIDYNDGGDEMSSGKYRITKIKRKWDENEKKAVEKVTK